MIAPLNPKLLDLVSVPGGDETSISGALIGTVVNLDSSGTVLAEVTDENGVGKEFIRIPENAAKVIWAAPPPKRMPEEGAHTLFEEGMFLLQNGLFTEAKLKFASSFNLDPNAARGLLNSTISLVEKDDFESAIGIFRMIIELQPQYRLARENLAITYLNRGVRSAKFGALDKAADDFTHALLIGMSPSVINLARRNLAAAHTQVALHHVDIQRFEEALQLFLLAFQLEPSEDTRKNFALALASKIAWKSESRSHVSENTFREALLLGLTFSECLNAYGATIARLGDVARAREVLHRALDLDPGNRVAKRNLDLLSEHRETPPQTDVGMFSHLETQRASLQTF
jgi:Tfp pilus assembly protein PilF